MFHFSEAEPLPFGQEVGHTSPAESGTGCAIRGAYVDRILLIRDGETSSKIPRRRYTCH